MVEVLTEQLAFGRNRYGYGTEGTQVRKLIWIMDGFDPATLFAGGILGVYYDPSDLSTLWKDVAGTLPVTADGDAVARINDKSGNGANATQAAAGKRPLYKTSGGLSWLEFDGIDDELGFTALAGALVTTLAIAGRITPSGYKAVLTLESQIIYGSLGGSSDFWGGFNTVDVSSGILFNTNKVIMERSRAANDVDLITNGVSATVTTGTVYGSRACTLGANTGIQFSDLKMYGALAIQKALTADEVSNLNAQFSAKAGI